MLLSLFGCATTGKLWPSADEWKQSAATAAKHPGTWIPLVGAGVIAIGGWDREISDWARRETPLFGSTLAAKNGSDVLLVTAYAGMLATAAAAKDSAVLRRLTLEHAGMATALLVREPVRRITDRDRPNGEPMSFPSGHSALAFANVGMTYRNVEALHPAPAFSYGGKSLALATGALTAWARVEAGKHYPTDVLVGAALGNFAALWMYDAFLDRDVPHLQIGASTEGGLLLTWRSAF